MWATTSKVAAPLQVVALSLRTAVSVILNPGPAGSPPMRAEIVVECETSIAPAWLKPPGPVIE